MYRFRPILLMIAALLLGGCDRLGVESPFASSVDRGRAAAVDGVGAPARAILSVARFAEPTRLAGGWSGVGDDFSLMVRRELSTTPGFTVRDDSEIGDRVAATLRSPGPSVERFLKSIGEEAGVDLIVVGEVTKFEIDADGSSDILDLVSRGAVGVVEVRIDVVDLNRGEIARSFTVTDSARGEPTGGRLRDSATAAAALHRAAGRVAARIALDVSHVAPSQVAALRIITRDGPRRLTVTGGALHAVEPGQRYFVCVAGEGGAVDAARCVLDAEMQTDLIATITHADRSTATAWMLGDPGEEVDLTQAVLLRERPPSR